MLLSNLTPSFLHAPGAQKLLQIALKPSFARHSVMPQSLSPDPKTRPQACWLVRKNYIMSKNSRAPYRAKEIFTSLLPARGGVSRTRTDDPLLAKQVLYQLSYNP
jgi:hypothetical protein